METDGKLLSAFVAGDQKAFAALVGRHADWVWGCALRQVKDSALAEDITQGALLLLAKKAAALKDRSSVQGWLFRVVLFLARDARKLANRRRYHETRVAAMNREQAPDGRAWDAIQGVLDEAVAQLREQDRQAILLRFYRGMSLVEVAGMLRVSEEAAGKRVSRAVERLRQVLGRQGINTGAQVQELLAGGLTCAAPAALVAELSAGGGSAAGTLMAVKAAKMLLAVKLKVAATVVGLAVVAGGVTGGIAVVSRPAKVDAVRPAAVAPTAPAHRVEPVVAVPPVREGQTAVAVCSATLVLPQNAVDELVAATQLVRADTGIQSRVADSAIVRPILRDLMPLNKEGYSSLVWRWGGAIGMPQQLKFGTDPDPVYTILQSNITVSAGAVTQIAGGYQVGVSPKPLMFRPIAFGPGRTVVQVLPINTQGVRRNLVIVHQAVAVDASDASALATQTGVVDWFAKPINEHLQLARAGAVWSAQVSDASRSARRLKAKKLPGGAEIWVNNIHDGAVHPIAAWTMDGQPAGLQAGVEAGVAMPTAQLRIDDPNVPARFSPTGTYEASASIPLTREAGGGYACSIGYGDGPYKTVAKMEPVKGAMAEVSTCMVEIEWIEKEGVGQFKLEGELESDVDVEIVAIRQDGTTAWNQHRSELWLAEGRKPEMVRTFSYGVPLAQIAAIEVRTRPLKWVSFEGLAKRPAVPLPTGLEPPLDPGSNEEQTKRILAAAAATPAGRKAFLDKVQCMRWCSDSAATGKQELWVWRDGRYRVESWMGDTHTLELGDGGNAWQHDFARGAWTVSKKGRSQDHDFAMMLTMVGGLETIVAMGETIGKEEVHGVPCTVRSARMESTEAKAKVWLDSLGLIHRLDAAAQTGPQTVAIDYDPAGAERMWTVPDGVATQPAKVTRYEPAAEAYLAKAVPADKPIEVITSACRRFEVLKVSRLRDDLVLVCTSTQLTPAARVHREQTAEKWLATQLQGCGPAGVAWTPRAMARIHMPYREITWWAVQMPRPCDTPERMDLLVQLGHARSWAMEDWVETQPEATRLHQISLDLKAVPRVDLDRSLKEIYAIFDGYRALGEAGKDDLVTASGNWAQFKATADKAIAGQEWVSESGR